MSSETQVYNLVSGSATGTGWAAYGDATLQTGDVISVTTSDTNIDDINAIITAPFPATSGKSYTLTADVKATANFGANATGMASLSVGIISATWFKLATDWSHVSVELTPIKDASDARVAFLATSSDGSPASLYVRDLMLVEGTEPAAWAPAEGEELAGGGAQMSANLWSDATANRHIRADGTYLAGKVSGNLNSLVTGLARLTENQTIHFGASLRNAGVGVLKPFVEYKDAAGNLNWCGFPSWQPTDSWQRFEGTCVVPSGMTITYVGFNNSAATGDIQVANPVFSYGSPVTLATAAHTPYATQDHVAAEYATKAQLKVTSDAVTAEVTERGKLAGRVGTLESTANDVDKRLKSVESDYVNSATLNTTKESIEADISSTLTESKKYTDDSITTEVTNRNAAITAKADEINSSVEKTYITKDSADAMSAIGRNIVIGTYEIFNPVLDSDSNTYNYYSVSTWGKRELNNRITSASPENPMDICISFDWSTSGWDKWESSSDFTPEFDINFEYISMNHSISPSETNASGYYSEVTHVYPGNYSNFYVYPDSAFSAISETESIPIKLYAEGLKNVTLKIYNLKIEFGHAPTAWTLAPEDAQYIYSTKTELDQTAETISSSVSKKLVSIGENGTVSDLSSVMEQSADGVLVKFSKTVGEQTFQPAIELTTDSDYDNASTVNAAIKMWESLSIRNSGGTPVTEINGPTMKINKVVVVDSIRIGTWLLASRSETTTSGSSEIIEIRSI